MIEVELEYFSIRQIAESGQCFRMKRVSEAGAFDSSYEIIAGDRYLSVTEADGGKRYLFDCSEDDFIFWRHYFDMDTDYKSIIGRIAPSDDYLQRAAAFGSGIRILHQELWEMLITFLISQMNNIKRIKRCIENISEKYGKRIARPDGICYYAFPTPEELKGATVDELLACNLGYRAKYITAAARRLSEEPDCLLKIEKLPYKEAKKELLTFFGVGSKVADCICLFALHKLMAFPIDTHIDKVLKENYPDGFDMESYHDIAGVMQQYIFYYDLIGKT